MRLLTWNINSVRLRLGLLLRLLEEQSPDIVCLQETKTRDEFFPLEPLADAGYEHAHIHGMKGYNGVAVLSREPFRTREIAHHCDREDCRHIAVSLDAAPLPGPVQIHCLYVPAGGDEPDPETNDKFAHKLSFVDEMSEWFAANIRPDRPAALLGDFNIAPLENDVWSHKQLLNVVCHTPAEVGRLAKMQGSVGWRDALRHFVPEEEKAFTWWSYRNRDWKKSNRGRRLDHIWLTEPLMPYLRSCSILREVRDRDKPSDHVPVIADIGI